MTHKTLFVIATCIILASGCGSDKKPVEENQTSATKSDTVVATVKDASKGIGKFTSIQLTHPLDESMITNAQPIYDSKCFACHKLTDEKLVGPGWKGITDRRTPEWVMNFIVNTNVMLDSDLVAQSEMVTCIVRMPNQSLTDEQARQMLEFMRKNDGKK
jgi:hypothetical protein